MQSRIVMSTLLLNILAIGHTNCPNGVLEDGVTDDEKSQIINKHYSLRFLIENGQVSGQPRGYNLKYLQWDDYLAWEAQNIARSCNFAHVKINDGRWAGVGQNIGTSWSSETKFGADWDGRIQEWFDEHKYYRYPDRPNSNNGHYTQVVWADTELVGCGYTSYMKNGYHHKLYVCNYGPGGNIVGQAPYSTQ